MPLLIVAGVVIALGILVSIILHPVHSFLSIVTLVLTLAGIWWIIFAVMTGTAGNGFLGALMLLGAILANKAKTA